MATAVMDQSDHKEAFSPLGDIDENKMENQYLDENLVMFDSKGNLLDIKYEVPPLDIDLSITDENRKRRFSVSAEPSDDKKVSAFNKKVYPKSQDALSRIRQSIKDVFLFQGMEGMECKDG